MSDPRPPIEPEDDVLLAELRAATAGHDPVPDEVIAAAKASLTWLTIDAELADLAELTFDSADANQELAGVRGPEGGARLLSFESSTLGMEVEVHTTSAGRRLVGQIVPGQEAVVELHHAGGTSEVEADHLGRFSIDLVSPGPVRFDVRGADEPGPVVRTSWVSL